MADIKIYNKLVVTESAEAAEALRNRLKKAGYYFPILTPPREPQLEHDILRLKDLLELANISEVNFYKVGEEIISAFSKKIDVKIKTIEDLSEISNLPLVDTFKSNAIEEKCVAIIAERDICNNSNSIIIQEYASYHNADIYFIESLSKQDQKKIREFLREVSETNFENLSKENIESAKAILKKNISEEYNLDVYEKILFISDEVPYGLLFPEQISTHCTGVNLGHQILRGLASKKLTNEKKQNLVGLFTYATPDQGIIDGKEKECFISNFTKNKNYSIVLNRPSADSLTFPVELLPYDFLYVVSHSGQLEGFLVDFKIYEDNGVEHIVSVEECKIAGSDGVYIVSIDGISLDSDEWQEEQYSHIISKFNRLKFPGIDPSIAYSDTRLEEVGRRYCEKVTFRGVIVGTSQYESFQFIIHRLACGHYPLIILNSCSSWFYTSGNILSAGSSGFIGTLWDIRNDIAIKFAEAFFENFLKMPLIEAFHIAKKSALTISSLPSPYILSGTFETRFDQAITVQNKPRQEVISRINKGRQFFREMEEENIYSPTFLDSAEQYLSQKLTQCTMLKSDDLLEIDYI